MYVIRRKKIAAFPLTFKLKRKACMAHCVLSCMSAASMIPSFSLRKYSGIDREQDLRAYEGKQLRMYQETHLFAFFIYVKL